MARSALDLTDLTLAALKNEPQVVEAFGRGFPASKLHLPLTTLEGVKNRPETALELGAQLPIHWLRLDNREIGVPLFTRLALSRGCAERLSWRTDGNAIRTLSLSGETAVAYLKELLVSPDVGRAILNPLDDSELHLARTDITSIASGRPLRSLWFYQRHGKLKLPVTIEGADSLLDSILSRADRALSKWTQGDAPLVETRVDAIEVGPRFEKLAEPLGSLARRVYTLLDEAGWRDVEVTVTKTRKGIRVTTEPMASKELVEHARQAALELLAGEPDGTIRFQLREGDLLVSSSVEPKRPEEPTRPRSEAGPAAKETFSYIPLEPEPLDED